MDIGHVLTPLIIGSPYGAARYLHPSRVEVAGGVVSGYSEFVEHIAQVLRDPLIDLPDAELATLIGGCEVLDERLIGTGRTGGAL